MSEKLLIDAEIVPAHVADEAVGFELSLKSGISTEVTLRFSFFATSCCPLFKGSRPLTYFSFFPLAQRKNQRDIHPLQGLPLYGEDANRESQKPPILCGFWYRGTRDEFLCCRYGDDMDEDWCDELTSLVFVTL